MHGDTFRAVESGATVLTASRRLARVLTQAFHSHQSEQGRSVWKTPDILPLDAFLSRAWRNHILRAQQSCPTLLDSVQEQMVWEQVIRESPAGESLLMIPQTARRALEAWQLVQGYRLPVDGRFEASEDWAAFAAWSRSFRKRCQANNWLERARLSDLVADLLKSGRTPRPSRLYLSGFDEFTPQQSELLEALGEWHEFEKHPNLEPATERWKLRDATEEIQAVVAWARRMLEQNPEARIGVIVPDLTRLRSKVERIFQQTLDSGSFHLSLGPALDQYPVVRAALLMLEFGLGSIKNFGDMSGSSPKPLQALTAAGVSPNFSRWLGSLPLPRAGMLLRSPFLGGADAERTKRALLDGKLRRHGVWDLTAFELHESAGTCPSLQRALLRFEKGLDKLPDQQRASEWCRDFSRLLEALAWPGDRTLSSREYQVVEAWHGLLSSLASLDVAAPAMNYAQALDRLRQIAADSPFQVENEGAPVQIMGMLEASGLRFDHLWVMGLHDEALPAGANPNPFIPISLQREHKLPHSSAERELEFATHVTERLFASSRNLVLSYPEAEGDRTLSPSPVVTGGRWLMPGDHPRSDDWIVRMRAGLTMEELHDEAAPPVSAEALRQPGGTSLFKDMAACAFRAFAKHRLGAKPLEETDLGLSYKDRGSVVHKALELIWGELGSHAGLMALTPGDLKQMVSRNVAAAVQRLGPGIGRKLEQLRLEKLLAEWLEIEKSRDPFTARKPEEEQLVTIGGVQVRTRADRVDKLDSGREIILDYKTGQVKSGGWEGDRQDEPQIPLYCVASERPIAGAAFVLIRAGELGFKGLTEEGVSLPGLKKMNLESPVSFAEQTLEWKRVLERLAERYRAGSADVEPKRDACDFCGLRALCRIREFENDRG